MGVYATKALLGRSAHSMLVLWTWDGAQSEWVGQEVGLAAQLGLLTIPIGETGVRPKGVP